MRSAARPTVLALFTLGLLWNAPAPASAHPLGNFTINQFSGIEVGRDDVTVHYVIDMAEIPTIQELGIAPGEVVEQRELDSYVDELSPQLLSRLDLAIDGDSVELEPERSSAELLPGEGPLDVLRVEVDWVGEVQSERAELVYSDDNFGNRLGWKEIVIYPSGGQGLAGSTVPATSSSTSCASTRRTSCPVL